MADHNKDDKQAPNPLKMAWYALTTVAAVASLSNMVGDVVQWKGILIEVAEIYRRIVYPVFEFLFSWAWWEIPSLFYDYCFIGVMIVSSFEKAIPTWTVSVNRVFKAMMLREKPIILRIITLLSYLISVPVYIIIQIFIWPLILGLVFLALRTSVEPRAKHQSKLTLKWLGAVVVGFLGLLMLNVAIGAWGAA